MAHSNDGERLPGYRAQKTAVPDSGVRFRAIEGRRGRHPKRANYAALAELPEKEKSAVVLRDIEGFSTAEVAEILGSSEATVRSQISTARIKIRKAIQRLKRGRK